MKKRNITGSFDVKMGDLKRNQFILGISCFYHDSAATIIKDGKVVAASEEERFTRKKHDYSFPINAINYCLESQGITINEVDYIGFYEKPILKFERLLTSITSEFPRTLKIFLKSMPTWLNQKLRIRKIIKRKLKYKKDIFFIEHHMSHAASTFLPSPFEKAAILTVDGVGEWTTTAYGIGEGNKIHLMKEIKFPSSLGLLYSTITAYLGFSVNNSEYKVMGLSAYGTMDKKNNEYYQKLKKIIDIKEDGSYRLDMNYFSFLSKDKMPSQKLSKLLGSEPRKKESEITQRHKDIAAALQMILEEVMTKILNHLHNVTKCDNLVIAGGVALNSVFNGKILKNTNFKNIWIQPNATDGGNSMGAALYIYNSILGNKRTFVLKDAYLGPEFSQSEIKIYLDDNKIKYYTFKDDSELLKTVSELIHQDNVVG